MKAKKILYLPVKKQFFDLEASGVKPEEYREITPYWVKRLLWDEDYDTTIDDADALLDAELISNAITAGSFSFRQFTHVVLMMGYPRKEYYDRHLCFEIKEIVIGKGNPDWGAPADRVVFIIKFGEQVKDFDYGKECS